MNGTHDPSLRSWVEAANTGVTDFPIQNLPFGVFRPRGAHGSTGIGVAIGDQILDLGRCFEQRLLDGLSEAVQEATAGRRLNPLMALGAAAASTVRARVSEILRASAPARSDLLVPMKHVELVLPATIGDYTDFYASVFHATNVGALFRPDHPLLPNYKHVPIAYHGRSSSIVVSGTSIRRPWGQVKPPDEPVPVFQPSARLDYEAEVAALVGVENERGRPIPIDAAERHIFGLCLLNDWSARDIQAWEYQPLGPFLAKNFATTMSPWVVTLEALEPFRCPAFARPSGDPSPLTYLSSPSNGANGGFDVTIDVHVRSALMRERGLEPVRVSRGSLRDMYWTLAQLVTHHTSNGCNLRPGDALASGTISGPREDSRGCLLELTQGSRPLVLPDGETRLFLADGDEVILSGFCERADYPRIGFGDCTGIVLPAQSQ